MFHQTGPACKTLLTFGAGERPLPRVDFQMEEKTGLVQETLFTEGAREGLVARVDGLMDNKSRP